MTLAAGTILRDTYEVGRRVGEGGMGEVYEARHVRLPGRFAVKILLGELATNPEAFARFRREAEITSALRHPNIVQVIDFNRLPTGASYIVMEYLEGTDLASRLRTDGRMPIERVVALVDQIASALAAAHRQGVVHRDLKPDNIFLVPVAGQNREFAKVVDFGISKVKAAATHLTRESAVMGTPQYMSPEQALGRGGDIEAGTDQFALGAIVYEMLAGAPAFSGDSVPSILYKVVHEAPPPLESIAPWLGKPVTDVVSRALAKRREDRFPSVLEFAAALETAAAQARPDPGAPAASPTGLGIAPTATPRGTPQSTEPTPKPTTFGAAAAETSSAAIERPARSSLAVPLVAIAVVAAGAAAIVGVMRSQDSGVGKTTVAASQPAAAPPSPLASPPLPSPKAAVEPEPAAPTEAQEVRISVDSSPQGAEIRRGGTKLGTTPAQIALPRGAEVVEIEIAKEGYGAERLRVIPDFDKAAPLAALTRQKARAENRAHERPRERSHRQKAGPPPKPGGPEAPKTRRGSFVDDI